MLEAERQELQTPGIQVLGGIGVADVEPASQQAAVGRLIIGGGLGLATRAAMVQAVFQASDRATVHMKDQMSAPEGFLPFARAVLGGLGGYEPRQSPNANLRAERPGSGAG